MPKISLVDIFFSHGSFSLKLVKIIDYILGGLLAVVLPSKKIYTHIDRAVRRILIIRPGGIGDAVFLLPILKELRAKQIVVDILCESRNAEVFLSQGYQVYYLNNLKSLGRMLKNPYDAVIDTEQWHFFTAIIGYFIKTDDRIGFGTRALRAKLFNRQIKYVDDDYELNNFFNLFEDILSSQKRPNDINRCYEISLPFKIWANLEIPANSVAVFLGSSIALRRFSKEQIVEIINHLLSGLHPVLLGGRDVLDATNQVIKEINNAKVFNFVGKVSLSQSAALIGRAQKFIGPDSGLMHLACAVGTPVVAIFGPGHLQKWSPRGNGHQVITKKVSCSPCTKFGYTIPTCHGTYHCLKNIKIEKDF